MKLETQNGRPEGQQLTPETSNPLNLPPLNQSNLPEVIPPSPGPKPAPAKPARQSSRFVRPLIWVLGIVAALAVIFLLYLTVVRPWHLRWGATEAELKMSLPGDELVSNPAQVDTMGITIKAPSEKIWPWLVQIGYNRAGWYSYEGIEDALGAANFVDGHTANRIVPELQNLKVGDRFDIIGGMADGPSLRVIQIEPNRALVTRWAIGDKPADGPVWSYVLVPVDSQTTRLLYRFVSPTAASLYNYLTDAEFYVMYHKMLVDLKERAERNQNLVPPTIQSQGR